MVINKYSNLKKENNYRQKIENLKKRIDAVHLKLVEAELNQEEGFIEVYSTLEENLKKQLVILELEEAFEDSEDRFKDLGEFVKKEDEKLERAKTEAKEAMVKREINREITLTHGKQKSEVKKGKMSKFEKNFGSPWDIN